MIKRELVEGEGWISPERFNRLLAVYQVLPGPEAHELCVHLGMIKQGRLGGVLAGLGFMLPGFLLVLGLAWLYDRIDLRHPLTAAILLGMQIGVVALVVRAVHRIGEHVLVNRWLWLIGGMAALATLAGANFWIVLPAAGLLYALAASGKFALAALVLVVAAASGGMIGSSDIQLLGSAVAPDEASASALFLSGLKAGLLTFGGAYTAIPFVRDDVVRRGWLSDGQFLDSLAISSVIPAPLVIFATFVGYLAGGFAGALAITAGIFLPAFSFSLLFFDKLEAVIENERLHRFLEGVAAGVVGMIAVTAAQIAWNIAKTTAPVVSALVIFAIVLATLYVWKSKWSAPAVIVASAALGVFMLR
jgi:chromate transporter